MKYRPATRATFNKSGEQADSAHAQCPSGSLAFPLPWTRAEAGFKNSASEDLRGRPVATSRDRRAGTMQVNDDVAGINSLEAVLTFAWSALSVSCKLLIKGSMLPPKELSISAVSLALLR